MKGYAGLGFAHRACPVLLCKALFLVYVCSPGGLFGFECDRGKRPEALFPRATFLIYWDNPIRKSSKPVSPSGTSN